MGFRLVLKSMTSNDLQWRNDRYSSLSHRSRQTVKQFSLRRCRTLDLVIPWAPLTLRVEVSVYLLNNGANYVKVVEV